MNNNAFGTIAGLQKPLRFNLWYNLPGSANSPKYGQNIQNSQNTEYQASK